MSASIRSTTHHFEKQKVARFHRLDNQHIQAIESLYKSYPFLKQRMEIHMPFHQAKSTFSNGKVWLWPKFDKRPVGYLIFMEGFAPCIWYPERQEGMTFRWLLPPNFHDHGPTVCLANILAGESLLQIEDIAVYQGNNLWSTLSFSKRWSTLRDFWISLPSHQPLLAFKPQIVKPIPLSEWHLHYNPAIYWIIQPDHQGYARWYWKDTITTEYTTKEFIPPKLKRNPEILTTLCAYCTPYTKAVLPDTYSLFSQEDEHLGVASISTLELSRELRVLFTEKKVSGIPVAVVWHDGFKKYQITTVLQSETPITTSSFFYHRHM